jgi:hypothetical protein
MDQWTQVISRSGGNRGRRLGFLRLPHRGLRSPKDAASWSSARSVSPARSAYHACWSGFALAGARSTTVHPTSRYKIHAAVEVATDLSLAWTVETAGDAEQTFALGLLDAARERGFGIKTAIIDARYDSELIHSGCMDRGILPLTPLRETSGVKRGDHKPPCCRHGVWTFAGADFKRRASKWRCPLVSASPRARGSRRPAFTRSSRVSPSAAPSSIGAVAPSSASSAGSRMSGRCFRCASVAWCASSRTPT